MKSEIYNISEKLMLGPGVDLFDYIASCLATFIQDNNLGDHPLPLGFTFSFPVKQEGLAKGKSFIFYHACKNKKVVPKFILV